MSYKNGYILKIKLLGEKSSEYTVTIYLYHQTPNYIQHHSQRCQDKNYHHGDLSGRKYACAVARAALRAITLSIVALGTSSASRTLVACELIQANNQEWNQDTLDPYDF